MRKKQLKSKALQWYWFALVLIVLLCLSVILKLPNVQAMTMIVLVAVTTIYVMITQGMLRELRQQRLNASQPVIWPSVGWKLGLEVQLLNLGNGPALEVDAFLVSGSELKEHRGVDLLLPGETSELHFLSEIFHAGATGMSLREGCKKAAGEYTLLVEWRDLHTSGPYFQARLPFIMQVDGDNLVLEKQAVKIGPIRGRYLD